MSDPPPGTSAENYIRHYSRQAQRATAAAYATYLLANPAARPDEPALLALHRVGMLFLADDAGVYRRREVRVRKPDNSTVHQAPPWQEVASLMAAFFAELQSRWDRDDAITVAAFALWRIVWVHPFSDGNGRAATAFAYACLCAKLGAHLHGENTILDQISAAPGRCNAILTKIDSSMRDGVADLAPLRVYLDELLLNQIRAAEAARDAEA